MNKIIRNILLSRFWVSVFLIRNQYFEVYQTSDWQHVFSGDVSSDGETYYGTYDITWSGDEQRLVISTGSNGGKMYFI